MGSGVFTERAQGWSVRTQVGGHCSYSAARLKRRAMGHRAKRWALHWRPALLSQLLWNTGGKQCQNGRSAKRQLVLSYSFVSPVENQNASLY